MSTKQEAVYLTADVGGTFCRLELWSVVANANNNTVQEKVVAQNSYPSASYASLGDLIAVFLKANPQNPPTVAGLAVAGAVTDNKCRVSNLHHWPVIDGDDLCQRFHLKKCVLINDFAAVSLGILTLQREDLHIIHDVPCISQAPIAVLGAGTGLGEAYMTYSGDKYNAWSSEGGHTDFAPRNHLERALAAYMLEQVSAGNWTIGAALSAMSGNLSSTHPSSISTSSNNAIVPIKTAATTHTTTIINNNFVGANTTTTTNHNDDDVKRLSVERVVSGTGLLHIYNFLAREFPLLARPEVTAEMIKEKEKATTVITTMAVQKRDILCQQVLDIFIRAYGSEAGNLALKTLPFGGLYIAGGMASKIFPLMMEDQKFWRHMTHKGRLSTVLQQIPVYVIKANVEIGLRGARVLGRRLVRALAQEGHVTPLAAFMTLPVGSMPAGRMIDKEKDQRYVQMRAYL